MSRIYRVGIILFCLFHMTAVGLYSIPQGTKDPISSYIRSHLNGIPSSYLFITSQWQRWNLFSPNPLRIVMQYKLEKFTAAGWQQLPGFVYPRSSVFKHVDYFKILNAFDDNNERDRPVRDRFVESFCKDYDVPSGIRLRLTMQSYLVPEQRLSFAQWRVWQPEFVPKFEFILPCP